MRVHRPTAADIERERLIVSDRRYGADRPVIIDMLRRLRAASTPPDFYDLHLELFRRFKTRQDGIGALKKERSGHQSRRRELAAQVPRDVSAITAAQRDADAVEHAMEVEEALLSLLRVIGDGIAWRAMGYDRAAFGILGTGARVGRLAADEGLDPEIEQIDHYSGEGVFAIHNDLTGCLLHGDVTAIYPEWIEVVEVKRGRVDPNSAQMVRLRDAIELINKRRHTFEDGTVRDIVDYRSRTSRAWGIYGGCLRPPGRRATPPNSSVGASGAPSHRTAWAPIRWPAFGRRTSGPCRLSIGVARARRRSGTTPHSGGCGTDGKASRA